MTVTIAGANAKPLQALLSASGIAATAVDLAQLQALAPAQAVLPDVLVVDLRGERAMPPAVNAIRRQHPAAAIVIVTAALDSAFLLEAIHAGANEVLAEPLTPGKLERAITAVFGQRTADVHGHVYGFIGAKGGVGKTTVAVNVAAALGALAAPGRALLIDAHQFGGDAALFFGVEAQHSFDEALDNTARLDHALFHDLVTAATPNLDLLAASDRITPAAVDPAKLRAVIELAAAMYKYTVVDLARTDLGIIDGLDRLEAIVVVANQELATLRAGGRMVALLQERYGRERVQVVINRSNRHSDISEADIERSLGLPIAMVFPSDYPHALEALHRGRPLVLDNHHALARAYERFALRLSGVPPDAAPRPGLFFRRSHAGAK